MTTATGTSAAFDPKDVEKLVNDVADAMLNQYLTIGQLHGLNEDDFEAVCSLGYNQYNQGKFEEAAKTFSFLTFYNHLEPRYSKALAASLQMLKHYEHAMTTYAMALTLDATDPEPMLRIAECLIALGRTEEATEALEMVRQVCAETKRRPELSARAQALLEILSERTTDSDADGGRAK